MGIPRLILHTLNMMIQHVDKQETLLELIYVDCFIASLDYKSLMVSIPSRLKNEVES